VRKNMMDYNPKRWYGGQYQSKAWESKGSVLQAGQILEE